MRIKIKNFDYYIASADTSFGDPQLSGVATVSGNGDDLPPDDTATVPGDDDTPTDGTAPGDTGTSSGIDASSGSDPAVKEDPSSEEDKENVMQDILDSLRSELSEKDDSIDGLSDSLRSFMSYMIDTEESKAEKEAEAEMQAQADMEAQALAAADDLLVIFPDYEVWDYPIYIEYTVYPWGAGYYMDATQTCNTPEDFLTWYSHNVELCQSGGTLKEFYVRYITDCSEDHVYDYKAGVEEPPPEEPKEDLSPAILETLQGIGARLESMGADVSTISANALDYHTGMLATQDDIRQLQTMNLVTDMAIGFSIFLFLGYTIAHGFWQRMKAG